MAVNTLGVVLVNDERAAQLRKLAILAKRQLTRKKRQENIEKAPNPPLLLSLNELQKKGATLTVKKAIYSKQIILKHNKTFGGSLSDAETQQMAQISRNSLYLYKRELKEEIENSSIHDVIDRYNRFVEIIEKKQTKQ